MEYCNLRVLSTYSLFKSIIKIPNLLEFCSKNNIKAIGICEEMNMFGFVEFSKYAKTYKIKPIFGCLLKIENYGLIPVYIKNREGYEFLSYILSQYYIKKQKYIPIDSIKAQRGLICLIGGEDSIFYSSNQNEIINAIKILKDIFQEDLFIEIQPKHGFNNLLNEAKIHDLPIVCSNPVTFLKKEDVEAFYIFKCIGENSRYNQETIEESNFKHNHIHSIETLKPLFPIDLKEGFENSVVIAKKCNFIINESKPIIPKYSENGETNENIILRRHALDGLKKRLTNIEESMHQTYYDRLEKELKVLETKNFSGYFLITADFVKHAKFLGVPVGPARGSGAGSLVAYSLTITDIDPIKYDLIFERFLNPERNSMPDFDIDFCPERRKEVVEYLKNKYGTYNILQIITFGTMQPKALIRDLCRIFSISFKESDSISRLIPQDQVNPVKLQQAIDLIPQLKNYAQSARYKKIFDNALKLEGLVRNMSKHAAGIIISDIPVWQICPIYRDDKDDLSVQFDLQDIEYVGGIKFDFLGLRTLTVIDDTFKLIEKRHGKIINFNNIPTDDNKTFEFIKSGNLDGVFQFDGAGIRDIVLQLKPDTLEDLIVLNALYRPGPIGSIPSYIKRKHKQEKVEYLHPLTEAALCKTFGIMVYQEQVMKIAKDCGGYTDGEADLLRRAMGKKKPEEMKQQKDKFINGALEKGISVEIAEQLFALMNEFSGYGFNKSHSAPYALIAYVCAYLKAHYPGEFLCCFLSEEMSNTEKVVRFIQNVKHFKITILKPCVSKSFNKFSMEEDCLRYGLGAIKNIGETVIEQILKERGKMPYLDIYDFVNRNIEYLNKKNWESLVKSGALDIFNISRSDLIEALDDIKQGKTLINMEKWDYFTTLEMEKEAFGFFIDNYIKPIEKALKISGWRSVEEVEKKKNGNYFIIGEISSVRRKRFKDKSFYAFIELIDNGKIIYIIAFSDVLETHSNKIKDGSFVVFEISMETKNDKTRCVAKNIFSINDLLVKNNRINILLNNKEDIRNAYNIIEKSGKGNTEVYVYTDEENFFIIDEKIRDSIELRKMLERANITIFENEYKNY